MKILFWIFLLVSLSGRAQTKYFTKAGRVSFFSKAPLENIEAHNTQAVCVLDVPNGDIQFAVLMTAFQFQKALMQEHFNENYVESSRYPKAIFKGKILNPETINWQADREYSVQVQGDITLHGVTKTLTAEGTLSIFGGKIHLASQFMLMPADFKIKIEKLHLDKIAKQIEVTVEATLEKMK